MSSSTQRPSLSRTNLVNIPKLMTFHNKSNITKLKPNKDNAINDNQSTLAQNFASMTTLVNNLLQSVNTESANSTVYHPECVPLILNSSSLYINAAFSNVGKTTQ